jgi:hypothetical protein
MDADHDGLIARPRARWLLLLTLWGREAAATRRAIPLPELCSRAALVVIAEVTGQEGAPGDPFPIETWSDLAITRVVRGDLPAETPRVVTPGGALGGMRLTVSEAPDLRVDGRYLLLLTPRQDGGWRVEGGPDGALRLGDEAAAVASLGGCLAP